MNSKRLRRLYGLLVITLLLAGIPWYRSADVQDPLVGGIPLWAWITIGSAIAIAALTAWAALCLWPGEDREGQDG